MDEYDKPILDNISPQLQQKCVTACTSCIPYLTATIATKVYAFLCSLSLDTRAEESTNKGRVDMTLRFSLPNGQKQVYIFEFKMVDQAEGDGSALRQIKTRDYAAPYHDGQHRIFLIGMEFNQAVRNLVRFEWEEDI